MSQRQAPGPAAAKAPAPPQVVRRAIEKPPEQPHVQFPDDSPYMARGMKMPPICPPALWLPGHTEFASASDVNAFPITFRTAVYS